MEPSNFIYTIGHGNRTLAELVEVLLSYNIDYLIDVRSIPYSRYCPQFARQNISQAVNATGRTRYAYLGHQLGGYPQEAEYQRDGKTDYVKYAKSEMFQKGIARLRKGCCELGLRLCIMCSESDPTNCHRTRLISNELEKIGVPVRHIIFLPVKGRKENETDYESDSFSESLTRENSEAKTFCEAKQVLECSQESESEDTLKSKTIENKLNTPNIQGCNQALTKEKVETTLLSNQQVLAGAVRKLKTGATIEPDTYPEGGLFA